MNSWENALHPTPVQILELLLYLHFLFFLATLKKLPWWIPTSSTTELISIQRVSFGRLFEHIIKTSQGPNEDAVARLFKARLSETGEAQRQRKKSVRSTHRYTQPVPRRPAPHALFMNTAVMRFSHVEFS